MPVYLNFLYFISQLSNVLSIDDILTPGCAQCLNVWTQNDDQINFSVVIDLARKLC